MRRGASSQIILLFLGPMARGLWAQGPPKRDPLGPRGPFPWYRAAVEFPVNHVPIHWKFTKEPPTELQGERVPRYRRKDGPQ